MPTTSRVAGAIQRSSRVIAAATVAAMLICLAAASVALAGSTRTYKGGSRKDRHARLLLKVETAGRGAPRKVTLLKLSRATASCAIGPNEGEFSPRRFAWKFPYAMPVIRERSPKGRKVPRFEGTQTNGGAPTGGEEEEFNVTGSFSPNRRSATVTIERDFTVEGSAVESSEELVTCQYRARFKLKLKR